MRWILNIKTILILCISMFVLVGCGGSNIIGLQNEGTGTPGFSGGPGTSIISGNFTPSFNVDKEEDSSTLNGYYLEDSELTFTDTSTDGDLTIEDVYWDFGDGSTSTENSPKHSYDNNGRYKVSLTISNGEASETVSKLIDIYKVLENSDKVDFEIEPSSIVIEEAQSGVNFQDKTAQFSYTGESDVFELIWNFGDDSDDILSRSKNIEHTYRVSLDPIETYTVRMYATDGIAKEVYSKIKQFKFKFDKRNENGIYVPATHSAYYTSALQSNSLDADDYYLAISEDVSISKSDLFPLSKTLRTSSGEFSKSHAIALEKSQKAAFQDTTTYLRTDNFNGHFPEDAIFDFGDGTVIKASEDSVNCQLSDSTYPVCEYSYSEPGEYTITLTSIYEDLGKVYKEKIEIQDYKLEADFITDAGYIIPTGQAVSFQDNTDYNQLNAKDRTWDFGDSNNPTTTKSDFAPYVFHNSGSYNIILKVKTEEGFEASVTKEILVKKLEVLGKIRLDFNPEIAFLNEPVTLKSTLSTIGIDDENFEGYWEYREDDDLSNPPITSELSTLLDSPVINFQTTGYHRVKQIVANSEYMKIIEKNVLVMKNEDDFGNNSGGSISPKLVALRDTLYIGDEIGYDTSSKIGKYDFTGTTSVNPILRYTWSIKAEDGSVLEDIVSNSPVETLQYTYENLGVYTVEACAIDNQFIRDCSSIKTYVVDGTEVKVTFNFNEEPFDRLVGSPQAISIDVEIDEDTAEQPNVYLRNYTLKLTNTYKNRVPTILEVDGSSEITHTFSSIEDIGSYNVVAGYTLSTGEAREVEMPAEQLFSVYGENESFFKIESIELLNSARVNKQIGVLATEAIKPSKGDAWRWQVDSEEPFTTDGGSAVIHFPNGGDSENIGEHQLIAESVDNETYYYTKKDDFVFEVYTDQESDIDISIKIEKNSAGKGFASSLSNKGFTETSIGYLDYAPEMDVDNNECIEYTFEAVTSSDNIEEYKWFFGDGDVFTSTDKQVSHSYCIPETYKPILSIVDNAKRTKSVSTFLGINHTTSIDGKCPIALLTSLDNSDRKPGIDEDITIHSAIKYSCDYKGYQITWGAKNINGVSNTHSDSFQFKGPTAFLDIKLSAIDEGGNYDFNKHRFPGGGEGTDIKIVDDPSKGFYIPLQGFAARDIEGDKDIARERQWRWYNSIGDHWSSNNTTFYPELSGEYWVLSDYLHPKGSTLGSGYEQGGATSVTIYPALMFCSIGNKNTNSKVEIYNFESKDATGLLNEGYTLNFNGEPQGDDCSIDSDGEYVYYQNYLGEGRTKYDGTSDIPMKSGNITKILKLDDIGYKSVDVTEGNINYNGKTYLADYDVVGLVYYPPFSKYIIEIYEESKREIVLYLATWEGITSSVIEPLTFYAFPDIDLDDKNIAYRGSNLFVDSDSKVILGLPTGTFVLELLDTFSQKTLKDIYMVNSVKTNDGYLMLLKDSEDDNYPTRIIRLKGSTSIDPNDIDIALLEPTDYDIYYNGKNTNVYDGVNNGITGLRYLR